MANPESAAYVPGARLFGYERLAEYGSAETVDWTDKRLSKIVRLKVVTDPGFPYLDVSYCYGDLKDGTKVRVRLPFHQLPKKGARRSIVEHAKADGVYAHGLGILDALAFD
jgi:hypothetical protein